MTYMGYFDQVFIKGFIPLKKVLLLSKIVLVCFNEAEDFNVVSKVGKGSKDKDSSDEEHAIINDPNDFAKGLYL